MTRYRQRDDNILRWYIADVCLKKIVGKNIDYDDFCEGQVGIFMVLITCIIGRFRT